jgi:phenylalanyl-tRNA synthetase alpha chain
MADVRNLRDSLTSLEAECQDAIHGAAEEGSLEAAYRKYLGKKGLLRALLTQIAKLPQSERAAFGSAVNNAVESMERIAAAKKADLDAAQLCVQLTSESLDVTLPAPRVRAGTFHPITLMEWRLQEIFQAMGFCVLDYPEAETEYFNFDALNIPADHPARDMQDTFWLENGALLRTHTSAGQVRAMRTFKPPLRAIFPGRVFRHEATDASHEHTFHQLEGLFVDRKASVANLIASMTTLLSGVFGAPTTVRLRPGFFPFVEPGFELDIGCLVCGQAGCSVCKMSGWVELLPCGLVHPNVIRAGGLDPNEWQGWAFGLGLSRLVMMRYRIDDVRLLLDGDIRFLEQFRGLGLD